MDCLHRFFQCILFYVLSKAHLHLKQELYISVHTNANVLFIISTQQLCCLLLQMLELSKGGWILIGCQCFYHSSARKNFFWKVIPTRLFSYITIVIVVIFPFLIELDQLLKLTEQLLKLGTVIIIAIILGVNKPRLETLACIFLF